MNEELKRNFERSAEARQVREEAMEKLHRGGRKNQRRAVPEDFRALAANCYDDMFAAELRRLGDTLHTAQAASLGSQPLFAALPLVGRPEDPKEVNPASLRCGMHPKALRRNTPSISSSG